MPTRRWVLRRLLPVVAVVIAIFAALTARLLIWPAIGSPARADAVVVLAGPGSRLPVGLALARDHRAPVLVVSLGQHGYGGTCPAPPPAVRVICFDPDPGDTRGEAEYIGRLANRYHWHSLIMVTVRPQDTRARILMGRCFGGPVYAATAAFPGGDWPYQLAYGWGALLKALVMHRSC